MSNLDNALSGSSASNHGRQPAAQGPKYALDVEGTEVSWNSDTITAEDIIREMGWPSGTTVVEVDQDNNEITLAPGQPVEIKPGRGFGKKVKFKRG